jgi:hypothetical protein
MEKIMSKINDSSRAAALEDHRPLADSKLDAVAGGVNWNDLPGNEKYALGATIAKGLK